MALQQIVETTVTGLGYDLVEIERSAGGLLRITIDLPGSGRLRHACRREQFVTVEDCEKVTRQLQFALEVDGVEYKRLEVSSPGIDRPLRRHQRDFERFAGSVVDISLKAPVGAAANGLVSANRKKVSGHAGACAQRRMAVAKPGWQIVWSDAPPVKPGQKVSKKRPPPPVQALGFSLGRSARGASGTDCEFQGPWSGNPGDLRRTILIFGLVGQAGWRCDGAGDRQ